MLKQLVMASVLVVGLGTAPVYGQEAIDVGQGVAPQVNVAETLKKNYRGLEEQHMVVMVMARQYNKELVELRRMEAVFCDFYGLDVTKWHDNGYVWDEGKQSFIERPAEASKKAEAKD